MSNSHPSRALDGRHRQTVDPVRGGRKRVGRRGREPGPTRGGRGGAAIGAALVAVLSIPAGVGAGGLPGPVEAALARHHLPAESLSVLVQDVAAPESVPLVSHRADVPRHPASTIKLLTTLAALEELGPAYAWETGVHVTGPVRDGRLEGDLVLVGGGDPFLVVEQVWRLLSAVRARGLREVAGRLVIDNTRFSVAGEPPPGEFDDQPYRAYNAPPDALLVNFNALDVVVEAREGKVRAWTEPPVAGLRVQSRLALSAGGCARRDLRFEVSGPLSAGPRSTPPCPPSPWPDDSRATACAPRSRGRFSLRSALQTESSAPSGRGWGAGSTGGSCSLPFRRGPYSGTGTARPRSPPSSAESTSSATT